MALVCVREPFAYQHQGIHMVITPDRRFDDDDPIVKANPRAGWEVVSASAPTLSVESATANPGEQRRVKRPS